LEDRGETGAYATRLTLASGEMLLPAAVSATLKATAEETAGETPTGTGELRVGLAWRQDGEATAGEMTSPAPVPPVVNSTMLFSTGEGPAQMPIPVALVVKSATPIRFTTAMEPCEVGPAFIAGANQTCVPGKPQQLNTLPAAVSTVPALAGIETTLAMGYVNLQITINGPLPVKLRFSVVAPFPAAVRDDDDGANVSCEKKGLPNKTSRATTKIP
jgi:hypothetical protein